MKLFSKTIINKFLVEYKIFIFKFYKVDKVNYYKNFNLYHNDKIYNELDKMQLAVKNSSSCLTNNYNEIDNKIAMLFNIVNGTAKKVNEMYNVNAVANKFYNSNFEKNFSIDFYNYFNAENFEKKYLELIKDLSDDDIEKINNIINRIKYIHEVSTRASFYNNREQQERQDLFDNFFKKIVMISPDLYVYGKYKLPKNHFEPCVFYHRHGLDTLKNKQKIREKNIIDAGAFIGDSALILSEYTDKLVYSFEAITDNIRLLEKTLELNSIKNVIPINKALLDKEEVLDFNKTKSGSTSSFIKLNAIPEGIVEKVSSFTLDSFVKEHNLEVGLIKVDIEGSEQLFLKGAIKTIIEQRPTLLISIYHKPEDFFEIKTFLDELNLGYSFKIFNPVDRGVLLETMLIAECN